MCVQQCRNTRYCTFITPDWCACSPLWPHTSVYCLFDKPFVYLLPHCPSLMLRIGAELWLASNLGFSSLCSPTEAELQAQFPYPAYQCYTPVCDPLTGICAPEFLAGAPCSNGNITERSVFFFLSFFVSSSSQVLY
jgi:hypothetical protein